eukprot:1159761-Pelagomonas_calceolata.AAC.7
MQCLLPASSLPPAFATQGYSLPPMYNCTHQCTHAHIHAHTHTRVCACRACFLPAASAAWGCLPPAWTTSSLPSPIQQPAQPQTAHRMVLRKARTATFWRKAQRMTLPLPRSAHLLPTRLRARPLVHAPSIIMGRVGPLTHPATTDLIWHRAQRSSGMSCQTVRASVGCRQLYCAAT